MAYTKQLWVANTTPVTAAKLNYIEAGIEAAAAGGAGLPADTVVVAATRIIANKLLAGDTQPSWRQMGDGKLEWGVGGTTAPDTSLYRSAAANQLRTPGQFELGGHLWMYSDAARFYFGAALDTSLYRTAAATLKTDGQFYATGQIVANLGTASVIQLDPSGKIVFNSDTNLYRLSAGVLKSDGAFILGTGLYVGASVLGGSPGYGISFGSASDTNLYRRAAGYLQSDGGLSVTAVTGGVGLGIFKSGDAGWRYYVDGDGKMSWSGLGTGGGYDTNLYRSAALNLKTDGVFRAAAELIARDGVAAQVAIGTISGNAGVLFGSAGDTNLYRSAAANLTTDGTLNAVTGLQLNGLPVGMVKIAEVVLGSIATTMDFSSIPATFGSLLILLSARNDTAQAYQNVNMRLNNDSTAAYAWTQIVGSNGTASHGTATAQTQGVSAHMPAGNSAANMFSSHQITLYNYASATTKTSWSSLGGSVGDLTNLGATAIIQGGMYTVAGTVNRVTLIAATGNFVAGTRATLYGCL